MFNINKYKFKQIIPKKRRFFLKKQQQQDKLLENHEVDVFLILAGSQNETVSIKPPAFRVDWILITAILNSASHAYAQAANSSIEIYLKLSLPTTQTQNRIPWHLYIINTFQTKSFPNFPLFEQYYWTMRAPWRIIVIRIKTTLIFITKFVRWQKFSWFWFFNFASLFK